MSLRASYSVYDDLNTSKNYGKRKNVYETRYDDEPSNRLNIIGGPHKGRKAVLLKRNGSTRLVRFLDNGEEKWLATKYTSEGRYEDDDDYSDAASQENFSPFSSQKMTTSPFSSQKIESSSPLSFQKIESSSPLSFQKIESSSPLSFQKIDTSPFSSQEISNNSPNMKAVQDMSPLSQETSPQQSPDLDQAKQQLYQLAFQKKQIENYQNEIRTLQQKLSYTLNVVKLYESQLGNYEHCVTKLNQTIDLKDQEIQFLHRLINEIKENEQQFLQQDLKEKESNQSKRSVNIEVNPIYATEEAELPKHPLHLNGKAELLFSPQMSISFQKSKWQLKKLIVFFLWILLFCLFLFLLFKIVTLK